MSEETAVMDTPQVEAPDSHLQGIFGDAMGEPVDETVETEAVEDSAEEVVSEEPTAEEPSQDDKYSQLLEQMQRLETQNENAQSLINRQGNELGELRKMQTEGKEEPTLDSNEYLNKFADDPVAAQKELFQQEIEKRDRQAREATLVRAQNRQQVDSLVPEFDGMLSEIKQVYKDKGAKDDFVSSLTLDDLSAGNVDAAVFAGEVVRLRRQLAETQSKNDKVIDKLNKGGQAVSGKTGQSANSTSAFETPTNAVSIANLSDAQLEAAMKRVS